VTVAHDEGTAQPEPAGQLRPRRIGRPRAAGRPLVREPIDEILHQAGVIFAGKGFDAATTREIAEAAGLRPASIFHYFPKKIDILVALSRRVLRPHLELVRAARDDTGRPASQRLHSMVYEQVMVRLREPFDLLPVMLQQDLHADRRFDDFRADLLDYNGAYQDVIVQGQRSGEFVGCDPFIGARAIIGMVMWLSFWRTRSPSAEVVATQIADRALASVLSSAR
jgi:AcrR family transcriptional regulator